MLCRQFPRDSGGAKHSLGPMTNIELHNLPSLCFHPVYGCQNFFIVQYFKVIMNEALDMMKWMAKLRLTSVRLQFHSTRNRDHFIYDWKAAFHSLLHWENNWKINFTVPVLFKRTNKEYLFPKSQGSVFKNFQTSSRSCPAHKEIQNSVRSCTWYIISRLEWHWYRRKLNKLQTQCRIDVKTGI